MRKELFCLSQKKTVTRRVRPSLGGGGRTVRGRKVNIRPWLSIFSKKNQSDPNKFPRDFWGGDPKN